MSRIIYIAPGHRTMPNSSRWTAYVVLLAAGFLDLLDTTVVNVAVSSIQRSLSASLPDVQWVIASYMLAFGLLLITGGRLGDLFGRRRMFVAGVSGFTIASLAAGLAPSIATLIAARAVQGAAAAIMVPQILAIAQILFSPAERPAAFGLYGGVTGLAAVAGPLLGGFLVQHDLFGLGWRPIFLLNVPVGIAAIVLTLRLVPESRADTARSLDLGGVALVSVALLGVLFPLMQGQSLAPWVRGAMVLIAAVAFAMFVRRERSLTSRGSALVPMTLFRERAFSAGLITSAVFFAATATFFLTVSMTLQLGLGFSAMRTGLTWLPFSLAAMAGSGMSIAAAPRLGRRILQMGAAVFALGVAFVVLVLERRGIAVSAGSLTLPMMVSGLGMGLVVAPLVDVILAGVHGRDAGAASGVLNATGQVGQAIGVATLGALYFFALAGTSGAEAYLSALRVVLIADVAVLLGVVALTVALPARRIRTNGDDVAAGGEPRESETESRARAA